MKVSSSILTLAFLSVASAAELTAPSTPVKIISYDSPDGHDHSKLTWAPKKVVGSNYHNEDLPEGGHFSSYSAVSYASSKDLPEALVNNVAKQLHFPDENIQAIEDAPKSQNI